MNAIGTMLADAARVGLRYQKRLTPDIPDALFARLARVEGKVIDSNHPAFILGHLALYPAKTLSLLGQPLGDAAVPSHFEKLFSRDASCTDDVEGTLYPSKTEIVAFFEKAYEAALAGLRMATDAQLTAENPNDGPIKAVCPTLGSMLAFYMDGHVMTHLGQLSAWRRMQGLPSV